MTDTEQIIELAKLDGWKIGKSQVGDPDFLYKVIDGEMDYDYPDYLASRDAIVPVIEKCVDKLIISWPTFLTSMQQYQATLGGEAKIALLYIFLIAPPRQLSEALLRATGKWKES